MLSICSHAQVRTSVPDPALNVPTGCSNCDATVPAESVLDCPNRSSGEGKFLTGVRNRIYDEMEPKHGAGGVKRSTTWIILHFMKPQCCGIRNPGQDVPVNGGEGGRRIQMVRKAQYSIVARKLRQVTPHRRIHANTVLVVGCQLGEHSARKARGLTGICH